MANSKNIILYLLITFSFSWILWGSQIISLNNNNSLPFISFLSNFYNIGAWGPLIAAIVIALISKGFNGIRDFVISTISLSFKKIWFLPTFLTFPLILGIPLLIVYFMGQSLPSLDVLKNPIVLPIAFLVILFTAGPLQEEYGWRGTLQNQLQNKLNPLFSSLLVGLTWGLWHLPLFFLPEMGFYYNKPIWGLLISATLISVLFGWIYNNTEKSMLLMLLFHTMWNFSNYAIPKLESELASVLYMILLSTTVLMVVLKTGINLKTK